MQFHEIFLFKDKNNLLNPRIIFSIHISMVAKFAALKIFKKDQIDDI